MSDHLNQETNTVIAALRYYQSCGQGEPANRSDETHDLATNGGKDISLDNAGIDDLCERINLGQIALAEACDSPCVQVQEVQDNE